MVFRKLFKEAGPPRPRPSTDDDPRYAQYSSWSKPPPVMPMSQYPLHIPPQMIGLHQSAFQSTAFHPYPQPYPFGPEHTSYTQTLPFRALDSDQVYPGINYKPPSHQDRAKEMFSNALVSSTPAIQKQKKGHWRHKLFSRDMSGKMKKLNSQTIHQDHDQDQLKGQRGDVTNASMYPLPGTSQRNKLQRALDVLKIRGFTTSRRCSMDDLPITSSRESNLPQRNGMEQTTRKSLDSAYDTLRGRNAAHMSPYSEDSLGRVGVSGATENDVYLSINEPPHLDKVKAMQISPSRAHMEGEGSGRQHIHHEMMPGKDMRGIDLGQGEVYPTVYRPTIANYNSESIQQNGPCDKAVSNQDEWQQVHRKAVQKYQDWIHDISQSQQMHQMSNPDGIVSQNAPLSGNAKQAVYKLKGDQRQTTHIAQLFSPSTDRQGHQRQASGTLGLSLTRRGFAEKMFTDDAPVGILENTKKSSGDVNRSGKTKPLPDPPKQKIIIQPSIEKGKKRKENSTNGHHADIRNFDWGSLGPPSHLDLPATTSIGVDNGRVAAHERDRVVKTPVPEQRANEASFLDSVTTPYGKGEVQLVRNSIEVSPKDVINRIQEWRLKTSVTPTKNLYAVSASPTLLSDKQQSKDRSSVASDLTSVSRRATVENNMTTKSGLPLTQSSQVTIKDQKSSPRYDDLHQNKVKDVVASGNEVTASHESTNLARRSTVGLNTSRAKDEEPPLSEQRSALYAHLNTIKEKTLDGKDSVARKDWSSLIQNLAQSLESDTDNAVETLLHQHGKELRQLYKENPEFLLMLSLKINKSRMQQGASKASGSEKRAGKLVDAGKERMGQNSDVTERQTKIDERGEVNQLQSSLLDLHRRILDWRGDTESLTKRLSLLEQAVYTAK